MKNKALTVVAVLLFFAWGTIAWATGDFLLAENLSFLGLLRTTTYIAAALAVFLRYYLRRVPNEAFLIVGSGICSIALVLMAQGGDWIPLSYLIIGLARIVMIPANLGFAANVLGPKLGVVVTAGGFYAANAVLKPLIAELIKTDEWRYGLLVGAVLVLGSAIATWLVTPEEPAGFEEGRSEQAVASLVGKGSLTFVGIQVSFGLMSLLVFPLAVRTLGATTDAGTLEGFRQGAMFVGVMATLVYPGRFSIHIWLLTQLAGYLTLLVGFELGVKSLVYLGLCIDGVSFAVLERASELAYLEGVAGLPSASVVLQVLDAATRLALVPGEAMAAGLPLQASLWIAPMLPLGLLIILATPFKRWIADRLIALANRE